MKKIEVIAGLCSISDTLHGFEAENIEYYEKVLEEAEDIIAGTIAEEKDRNKMIAENIAAEILKQTDTADVANMIDDLVFAEYPDATENDRVTILYEFQRLIEKLGR